MTRSNTYFDTVNYIKTVFWYNFRDKGIDPYNWEHHMGLIKYNWDIKPAYEAYQKYIEDHPNP